MIHYEDLQKLKHKYGFFVLIFATTAMFFLQDKNVLLLCDAQPCLTLCNPMDYTAPGILQAWILEWAAIPFSKGIFPTQGSNPGLPRCRWILYQLSHKGSPRTLEWVAYPFSRGFSRPRNWTGVYCIAGGFFISWAIREAYKSDSLLLNWAFAHFWGNRQNQSKWMIV